MAFQPILRPLIKVALGFYFSRIDLFGAERVPDEGPLLIVANHPNSIVDAMLLGACVPRRLHFLATVLIFRSPLLAWILRNSDVIPVNRYSDDARAMRSVAETFQRCYEVLEGGGAIGIFPEGITHSDPQLKRIKSGAARIALEAEHRNGGRLGLKIVPVGLTFSRSSSYRPTALLHFGAPLEATGFLSGYAGARKESIRQLNARIEAGIRDLILHLPDLEDARLVQSVRDLYLDRVAGAGASHERLAATQAVGDAAAHFRRLQPARFRHFARRLRAYERRRARLRVSEAALGRLHDRKLAAATLWRAFLTVLLAPIAAYGWIHRFLPLRAVGWATRRLADEDKLDTQRATAAILAGSFSFTLFFALYTWLFHRSWGWPASAWYFISLPITSLVAHRYAARFRLLAEDVRLSVFWLRHPYDARRLLVARRRLLRELDAFREDYVSGPGAESAR